MTENAEKKLRMFEEFQMDTQNDGMQRLIKGYEDYCNAVNEEKMKIDKCPVCRIDTFADFVASCRQRTDEKINESDKSEKEQEKDDDKDEGDSDLETNEASNDTENPEPMTPAPDPSECIPLPQVSIPNSSLTM